MPKQSKGATVGLVVIALIVLACTGLEGDSPPEVCGDGTVGATEACDDGNESDLDGCTSRCQLARCGDGIVRVDRPHGSPGFESCDDALGEESTLCGPDCYFRPPEHLGGPRPAQFYLPPDYDPKVRSPLMVLLHGFGQNAELIERQMGGQANQANLGYILVSPEGTLSEHDGRQFWNATPACCNFHGSSVDDLAYLTGLIDEAVERLYADPKRVYIMGLSNGGFMAERIACDAAEKVTGIINVGGSGFVDPHRCQPRVPVTYLRVHGTEDATIPFAGQHNMPGAVESVTRWRRHNGCQTTLEEGFEDLDDNVEGAEANHRAWSDCEGGSAVHLFALEGGAHVPRFSARSRERLMTLVMERARP